jgi:hypothetical protein
MLPLAAGEGPCVVDGVFFVFRQPLWKEGKQATTKEAMPGKVRTAFAIIGLVKDSATRRLARFYIATAMSMQALSHNSDK